MATFSVPVTIGVNEEDIAKSIEKEVKERVISSIGEKVEGIIYREYRESYSRYGYGSRTEKDDTPLRNMIERTIKDVLLEKEAMIVELAAEKLADKLSRQKAVKAVAAEVAKDTLEV